MNNLAYIKYYLNYLVRNRTMMRSLVINDFKRQFLGTYFGVTWAFVQPLVLVLVLWLVFEFGFRARPVDTKIPFALWLMSGMFPWFYFASSMNAGLQAVVSNAFMVRKIAFNVDVLPLVKLSSGLFIHLVLLLFIMLLLAFQGVGPTVYWLQLPYYVACLFILLLGITSLTSALFVFVKDVKNVITISLQIGFWITPIFWSQDRISPAYAWLLQLNPMFYIVRGYRESLLGQQWFWQDLQHTMVFYSQTLLMLYLGLKVFRKVKPHFGDVL